MCAPRSADPFDDPVIQPNYLADPMDRRVLLGGMRLARRLLRHAGARALLRRRDAAGPAGAERRRVAGLRARNTAPPATT